MAAPSPGTPVATGFTTGTSMAINMPATINSGDRLVAIVTGAMTGGSTWTTIPSGWSQIAQQIGGGGNNQTTIFEKVAAGTEAGTTPTWVSSASTSATWHVIRVTGAHASTASEVTGTNGSGTNADSPSITPLGGAKDYLIISAAGSIIASNTAFTAGPSGYAGFLNSGNGGFFGTEVSTATATKQLTAATTEDPGAFTPSAANWTAVTIAVYPASGGGGGSAHNLTLLGVGT